MGRRTLRPAFLTAEGGRTVEVAIPPPRDERLGETRELLDRVGEVAKRRGMTDEKFDELLKDN